MNQTNIKIKNGSALAAILSAGIGCAVLGLNVIFCENSGSYKNMLTWSDGVGPLSGKTLIAVIVWMIAWFLLNLKMSDKEVDQNKIWLISLGLIIVGLLGTFPTFFMLFSSH